MTIPRRLLVLGMAAAVVLSACTVGGGPGVDPQSTVPVTSHPRLFIREADVPRLRSWATDRNPVYHDGLAVLAAKAKTAMDEGHVPAEDHGSNAFETYPSEWYAELFAFMSLIEPDQAVRDDYGRRARNVLMHVISKAAAGPGAEGEPFRDPRFATFDRSRWNGDGFGLTVDWAYPYFSAEDKAQIRQVFLGWAQQQFTAYPSETGGGGAPNFRPEGPFNDPALIDTPQHLRWSMNNYFTAHMRNMGLMAMALDAGDDPDGQLHGYLRNATGSWLYLTDHAQRTIAAGGLSPEGTEYATTALAFIAQFLVAMQTAGQADPARFGPQVVLTDNPFWSQFLPGQLASLPHAGVPGPGELASEGQVFQPAAYGDLQIYAAPDLMDTLGPLALAAAARGDKATVDAVRWYETNVPQGGPSGLLNRVSSTDQLFTAIMYFLVFDPAAPPPPDPRQNLPLLHNSPGLNRTLARTCWCPDARMFTYALTWKAIDHQGGDGNEFELSRRGEWLTKQHTGYDTTWYSDYHNTLTIENDPLATDQEERWLDLARRGSQVPYDPTGDPKLIGQSTGEGYLYAAGDATPLYNSAKDNRTAVTQASRAVVWLQPDHVVVYDRAETTTDGRFKRFWLQLPAPAEIAGNRATVHTPGGQQLFSTTLLPADAVLTTAAAEPNAGERAKGEPMTHRLQVDAPGGPRSTRFLHVIQGADGTATADPATLVQSSDGPALTGATVGNTAVVFPVDLNAAPGNMTITVPAGITRVLVTGLQPGSRHGVQKSASGGGTQLTLTGDGTAAADGGGVLAIGL